MWEGAWGARALWAHLCPWIIICSPTQNHYTPMRMATTERLNRTRIGVNMEQTVELRYTAGVRVILFTTIGNRLAAEKLNMHLLYHLVIPENWTQMIRAALFATAKTHNWPICPSTSEWISRQCKSHTINVLSSVKCWYMQPHGWISEYLCWVKQARAEKEYRVCDSIYVKLQKSRLICSDRKQISDCLKWRMVDYILPWNGKITKVPWVHCG